MRGDGGGADAGLVEMLQGDEVVDEDDSQNHGEEPHDVLHLRHVPDETDESRPDHGPAAGVVSGVHAGVSTSGAGAAEVPLFDVDGLRHLGRRRKQRREMRSWREKWAN